MKRSSRAVTLTLLGSAVFLSGCGAAGIGGQARNDQKKEEEQSRSGGGYVGGAGVARAVTSGASPTTAQSSSTSRGGFGSTIRSFFSGGS